MVDFSDKVLKAIKPLDEPAMAAVRSARTL